jgi:hypothetical protein
MIAKVRRGRYLYKILTIIPSHVLYAHFCLWFILIRMDILHTLDTLLYYMFSEYCPHGHL